jgi:hypothetical protein
VDLIALLEQTELPIEAEVAAVQAAHKPVVQAVLA